VVHCLSRVEKEIEGERDGLTFLLVGGGEERVE
jgi:hypothetical protein